MSAIYHHSYYVSVTPRAHFSLVIWVVIGLSRLGAVLGLGIPPGTPGDMQGWQKKINPVQQFTMGKLHLGGSGLPGARKFFSHDLQIPSGKLMCASNFRLFILLSNDLLPIYRSLFGFN